MTSFRPRPLRREDAGTVARLFVDAFGDARRMDDGEIEEWLDNEALVPDNLVVLLDDDDRVVGYFDAWPEGETVDLDVAAPGFWDEAFEHAENRARALGAKRVRVFLPDRHDVERHVGRRGYRTVRASWTMEVEFGVEAPAEPVVPDGIEIRPYRHPDDGRVVYEATQEAFAEHWGFHSMSFDAWCAFNVKSKRFDPDLWLVAWAEDEVAGASLNFPENEGDPGYGWVGTLAVRKPWRGRGVGEALLRRSFALLHARGLRKVRLSVDSENTTGATRLYERVGMGVLRQANTWEREL